MDVFFGRKWWLIRKNNTIWDSVSNDIKKEFDSEPVHKKFFLKTKIKSHGDEVTDFYDIPKVDSNHTSLAVISLDSSLNKDGNYYMQAFLKECKYIEKKVIGHNNDSLSDFSSDKDSNDSTKEYFFLQLEHEHFSALYTSPFSRL